MNTVERFQPNADQAWLEVYFKTMIDVITPYIKDMIILDAGCGNGYADSIWLQAGAKK